MKQPLSKGFSVVELIVAMAIFITLTAVLLANYNTINKRMSLDTLVHQMAQWVRETQVSAMSVRSYSGSFKQGYGLHFETASSTNFVFFADFPDPSVGNKRYDYVTSPSCGDATVECAKEVYLQPGNKITKICGYVPPPALPTYPGTCPPDFNELENLDVVFTRPNPDAEIRGDIFGSPSLYGNAVVYVTSVTGYERSISVWTTGQVTVQ